MIIFNRQGNHKERALYFETRFLCLLCAEQDSNLRRTCPTDLQSVPVDRLGIDALYKFLVTSQMFFILRLYVCKESQYFILSCDIYFMITLI